MGWLGVAAIVAVLVLSFKVIAGIVGLILRLVLAVAAIWLLVSLLQTKDKPIATETAPAATETTPAADTDPDR